MPLSGARTHETSAIPLSGGARDDREAVKKLKIDDFRRLGGLKK